MGEMSSCRIGESYIVIGLSDPVDINVDLSSLGLSPGKEFKVVKRDVDAFILLIDGKRLAVNADLGDRLLIREKTEEDMKDWVTLDTLKVGEHTHVQSILGKGAVKRHLMDMGITKGVDIFVRKVAPLGDPIQISLRGYELTLRKKEASMIVVENMGDTEK